MEHGNFEAFRKADIRICNLLPKNFIESLIAVPQSIGLSYLPPLFAERLNIYADKGHTILAEKPLEFYFNTKCDVDEDIIEEIKDAVMAIVLPRSRPSVCVFTHPTVARKLVKLINEPGMVYYWDERLLGQKNRLYDIYVDDHGAPRAQLVGLFCSN